MLWRTWTCMATRQHYSETSWSFAGIIGQSLRTVALLPNDHSIWNNVQRSADGYFCSRFMSLCDLIVWCSLCHFSCTFNFFQNRLRSIQCDIIACMSDFVIMKYELLYMYWTMNMYMFLATSTGGSEEALPGLWLRSKCSSLLWIIYWMVVVAIVNMLSLFLARYVTLSVLCDWVGNPTLFLVALIFPLVSVFVCTFMLVVVYIVILFPEHCEQVCLWNKKRSEEMQTLHAVVRRSQKLSPSSPLPRVTGWPKFNQLEMITTSTYKPSLMRIDARNFEFLW